MKGCCSAI